MTTPISDTARELLQGAIDMHVHAAPDPYTERRMDARELAIAARDAGMAGLVLKSHDYPTGPLAWAIGSEVGGINVYGAVSLDHPVGGLNPEAIIVAFLTGAKVAWMPTFDAAHWRAFRPGHHFSLPEGLTVLDQDGEILRVVHQVTDLISDYEGVLASGHLSPRETVTLLANACRGGLRCIVTHASFWMPLEAQLELAGLGAYIEQCAIAVQGEDGDAVFDQIAAQVRAVGPSRVVLSTDLGQAANPPPPEGFARWIDRFLAAGFTRTEVEQMVRHNPAALLS